MYSETDLRVFHRVCKGDEGADAISSALQISIPQAYRSIRKLRRGSLVVSERPILRRASLPHAAALADVVLKSPDSVIPLSDSGIPIICALKEGRTVAEVMHSTGYSQPTVSRKIGRFRRLSMVRRSGKVYSINSAVWPEVLEFARQYSAFLRFADPDLPSGTESYGSFAGRKVFSSAAVLPFVRTAFSAYGEYGIDFSPGINYYCTGEGKTTVQEVFEHSLMICARGGWRIKMMALIFYGKYRDEIAISDNPAMSEMLSVLSGEKAEGWAPLEEIRERAGMYGVSL